jgi:hypothetical protein
MSRLILVSIFTIIVTAEGLAQSSKQEPAIGELQKQLEEMRSQMVKMQNRIAELEAARGIAATSSSTDPVLLQSETPPAQALRSQADETKSPEEPTSFHYKGLTLTPGGFLEGTMLVRTRNENADIANTYSAIPLNGSSNAKLSEFRGTARNSDLAAGPRHSREHKAERICRNGFSRRSTDCQLRRIQFLDTPPETTVGSAR